VTRLAGRFVAKLVVKVVVALVVKLWAKKKLTTNVAGSLRPASIASCLRVYSLRGSVVGGPQEAEGRDRWPYDAARGW